MKLIIVKFILALAVSSMVFGQQLVEKVKSGSKNEIILAIKQFPEQINQRDDSGKKIMHYAAERGDTAIAKLLIDSGADINSQDWSRNIPLHYSAMQGDLQMYNFLLTKGADDKAESYYNRSALHFAAEYGKYDMLKSLVKKGVDIYTLAANEMNIMHIAAAGGKTELLNYLISLGMDVNRKNLFGKTALHFAVINQQTEIVKILLKNNIDIDHKSIDQRSAYNEAIIRKYVDIAKMLEENGADLSEWDQPIYKGKYFGFTPPKNKAEVFAPGIISTDDQEFAGTFSPDLEHFTYTSYGSYKNLKNNTIVETKLLNQKWSTPKAAHFSGKVFEFEPSFSPDGKKIIYGSRRKIDENDKKPRVRPWICNVENKSLSNPYLAGEVFRSMGIMYPTISNNGNIYLSVWEPDGACQIYFSELINGKYQKPVKLTENVNFCSYVAHSYIAPDESYILFDAQPNSPDSFENYIYISFKDKTGNWSKAKKLPASVNITSNLMCPSVSPDGKYLFFTNGGNIYWISANVIDELK